MSYRLEDGEELAPGIRRIAREEVREAAASLRNQPDVHEAIHNVRKRLKKVRAVLRLVRDDIGEDRYKTENVFYRDLGRELADLRDAAVAIDTLDALRSHFSAELTPGAFAELRHQLVERFDRMHEDQLDVEGRHLEVARQLEQSLPRVDTWPVGADRFDTIAPGLHRVYRRGRERLREAYAEPTFERLHEWRKRVKYLWYHMRLLRQTWPAVMDARAESIHEVSDLIGDSNDLSELAILMKASSRLMPEQLEHELLLALIETRREELREQARPLGRRIWAETPEAFVARVGAYWRAWRDDPEEFA